MPHAQVQFSVGYGYRYGRSGERAFGVGRHVVRAFERVVVVRLVFWDKAVENLLHVGPDVGVGVLVYG